VQPSLFDAGKPPKVRSKGPIDAEQWVGFGEWMTRVQAMIGRDRVLACTVWGCPHYLSGWTPEQFVRHVVEPNEKVRQ
jgi:hypothetical protein